jgi:hypothetical protein
VSDETALTYLILGVFVFFWAMFGLSWAISTFNLTGTDLLGMGVLLTIFGSFYRWYDFLLDKDNWRGPWDPPKEK